MVLRFEDFIEKVNEMGFLFFSANDAGLPCLADIAPDNRWHTGEDTDPWMWKDRAAAERLVAYGCVLNGRKGFVGRAMYPVFCAAYRPEHPLEQRWHDGELGAAAWALGRLFETHGRLRIDEIRRLMGVSAKRGGSRVDGALVQLMREFTITVAGSERKRSARGELYGWPVNLYERVEDWAPGWTEGAGDWPRREAAEAIVHRAAAMNPAVSRERAVRLLGLGV